MNQPDPPSDAATTAAEETVRKVYVRDLREKQPVFTVFRVTRKSRHNSRNGKSFLVLGFGDRTGEVDGRVFDGVDALENSFRQDDYVLVKGQVVSFHGKPQVIAESLERLDPEPIDPAEFALPTPPPVEPGVAPAARPASPTPTESKGQDGARAVAQIRELVERVDDPHVKALLLAFLDDPDVARGLPVAPAGKGAHHAYRGGLAEHILSVMKLSQRVADHYPTLDRDLLLAGALLHDIGKVSELAYSNGGLSYTDEGRLVGHVVMTAQAIHAKAARLPDFPKALEHHLTHLVLAHQGAPRTGLTEGAGDSRGLRPPRHRRARRPPGQLAGVDGARLERNLDRAHPGHRAAPVEGASAHPCRTKPCGDAATTERTRRARASTRARRC